MKNETRETSKAFDCLAVTNVQVFPFKEGPSMGHEGHGDDCLE